MTRIIELGAGYNRDGLLRVEGEDDIKGTSPGSMKSLNLDHGGYLGFTPLNSTKYEKP